MANAANNQLNAKALEGIVRDTLVPLLSGTKLSVQTAPTTMNSRSVVRGGDGVLVIKPANTTTPI